jgi:predicted exporter
MGNFSPLGDLCLDTVLNRIGDFVGKIKKILNVTHIPKDFKLNQVDPRVTTESIKSAVFFVSDKFTSDINIPAVNDLVSMCTTSTQQVSDAQEAERERNADADARVITGGRRSRYRHRPTKKYFKSRRHSSHKKKRHYRTKRHTKRHRKTKQHIKRY